MAYLQYRAPGPSATSEAIFDPTPLMNRVDQVITDFGGLNPENRHPSLQVVGVMTTMEGPERKPMLFMSSHKRFDSQTLEGASFEICYVDNLSAKHGFASAALPSVLPPVELDTEHGKVRLVDGGISQNIPVDPAVRVGAQRVIVIDISGRSWWLDHYGESHDTRPTWEVPAGLKTFCLRPPDTFVIRPQKALGPLLKAAVSSSTRKFIAAVGPVWPVFQLLKKKLGEEIAYEVMSYAALDPDYQIALMEAGYNETAQLLKNKTQVEFERQESYEKWADAL
jgi:predicted acylesterase/phospholipase RssA